jgi:hypothetical protein
MHIGCLFCVTGIGSWFLCWGEIEKTKGFSVLREIKESFTNLCPNSFEPVVLLPAWKSVIVDWLTLMTFGLCRWRWSGITLKEWYDGFTEVMFVASDAVKADPEIMEAVDGLMDAVGAKLDERTRVANRTLDALARFSDRLESGQPINATRITIEKTPDGPLTTVEDVIL